jgi:hypothetical protein
MRRNGFFSGWAILWAVLQFALPAAVTLADAELQRESARGPGAHVESTSDASCRPSHPGECALCQLVSRAAAPGHGPTLPEVGLVAGHACASPLEGRVPRGLTRVSLPRAPPASLA